MGVRKYLELGQHVHNTHFSNFVHRVGHTAHFPQRSIGKVDRNLDEELLDECKVGRVGMAHSRNELGQMIHCLSGAGQANKFQHQLSNLLVCVDDTTQKS